MAGHSKWATTKRHKAVVDAKRGKIFSVISKEITIAARDGGGEPDMNARLRTLIAKAKGANMPSDNIDRAIKKGTGELPGVSYETLVYEGYAVGGIGIIVEVTTDNKNKSASEVRSTFGKHGGNLAGAGALAFNFQRTGQFLIATEGLADALGKPADALEDALMEIVLEAGAEDMKNHGDHFEILCELTQFDKVSDALNQAGITPAEAELVYLPNTTQAVDAETERKVLKLIDALEAWDDVDRVHSNLSIQLAADDAEA